MAEEFDFELVGAEKAPFKGYISSLDQTMVSPEAMTRGSKNMYKKLSGTIANRPGLKRIDTIDPTQSGHVSDCDWNTSRGTQRILRFMANGNMDVLYGTEWINLLAGQIGMRYVCDPWYSAADKQDILLMVHGDHTIQHWSGGIGQVASADVNSITLAGTIPLTQLGFSNTTGLQLVINGVTYAYTSAGTNPSIIYSKSANSAQPVVNTSQWHAQKFTTGATTTQILGVGIDIEAAAIGTVDAVFELAIYTNNAGNPGTKVGAAQARIPATYSAGTFTVNFDFGDGVAVSSATDYFIQIRQISGGNTLKVHIGTTGGVGTLISTDSGATWSNENGYLVGTITENISSLQKFNGVTPDPSAILADTPVAQAVITESNVPSATFVNDFIKVIANQAYIGSYESRLVYISSNTDYTNYILPTTSIAGSPELLTLDEIPNGIGVVKQIAKISAGLGSWYTVFFSYITVGSVLVRQTNVEKEQTSDLSAALAHEFIDTIGDSLIYLCQDHQLRTYGTLRNINTPVYPSLSLPVQTELEEVDFTGGALRAIGGTVYITAPVSGVDYMYEERQTLSNEGNLNTERIWHAPMIRNIVRVSIITGYGICGHSNANPQTYQMWDTEQWHDDGPDGEDLPYASVVHLPYRSYGRRQGLWTFTMAFFELYMTEGTPLFTAVRYNYKGVSGLQQAAINDPTATPPVNAVFFESQSVPSLGDDSPGDDPLGDGVSTILDEQDALPKARKIVNFGAVNCFEHDMTIYSDQPDARWELVCAGTNAHRANQQPTWLQKK